VEAVSPRLPGLLLPGLLLLLAGGEAEAGPATARLRELVASADRILLDGATDREPLEKLAAIHRLVREAGDWDAAAARALGAEWHARTPAERREFTRLFADLLHRAVVTVIASRAQLAGGLRVTWGDERADGDEAVVSATIGERGGHAMPVQFHMGEVAGVWRIRDVLVAGVSVVENYRAQLAAVVRRSSYADLMAAMRSRASDTARLAPTASAASPPASEPPPMPGPARTERSDPVDDVRRPALARTGAEMPAAPASAARSASQPRPASTPERHAASRVAAAPVTASTRTTPDPRSSPQLSPAAPRTGADRPPVTPATAPPETAPRAYWVQVGAFRTVEGTARLAARLAAWPYSIVTGPLTRGPDRPADSLARVLVGPFAVPWEATRALERLQAAGVRGFVTEDRR
jgi:phospholipid transport system substrate-binding protein